MTKKRHKGSGRVKMSEVAEMAGVSVATVSRALQGSKLVSERSRKKIVSLAESVGYSHSPLARSLHGKPTPLIGVVVPALVTSFYAEAIQALSDELEESGYQIMIGHHNYNLNSEEKIVSAFASWNPSALIVTGTDHTSATTELLKGMHCPVIEMWDLDGTPIDSRVGFSNYNAGRSVAQHLLDKGRKNLIYVLSPARHDTRANSRFSGFKDEVDTHSDASVNSIAAPDRKLDAGGEVFKSIISEYPETDGIAFFNDPLAFGALREAKRQGVDIPGAISVVGFGDLEIALVSSPPLTTIRPPRAEIGKNVALHLLQRLESKGLDSVTIDVGFEMIVRESS